MNTALIALGFIIAYMAHITKIGVKQPTSGRSVLLAILLFKAAPLFLGVYLLLIGLGF